MVLGIARSKIYGTPILHFFWGYNSLPVFRIVYMAAGYTNTFRLPPSLNVIEGNVSKIIKNGNGRLKFI
jgi:hypothetical protein